MFEEITKKGYVFRDTINLFKRYPIFLVPLILSWITVIPISLFLVNFIKKNLLLKFSNMIVILLAILIVVVLIVLFVSFSNFIMLELIQQIETSKRISLRKAIIDSLTRNIIKIIPLLIFWSITWFILFPIDLLLGMFGYNMLKGIRMKIFLTIPGIAWENSNLKKSLKNMQEIIEKNGMDFSISFGVTLSLYFTLVPSFLQFFIYDYEYYNIFPNWTWMLLLGYAIAAWCFVLYIEQLVAAELYLWYFKWKEECKKNKDYESISWSLWSVNKPSIIDDQPDLKKYKKR